MGGKIPKLIPRPIHSSFFGCCNTPGGFRQEGATRAWRVADEEQNNQRDDERVNRDSLGKRHRDDQVRADNTSGVRVAAHRAERRASGQADADARANSAETDSQGRRKLNKLELFTKDLLFKRASVYRTAQLPMRLQGLFQVFRLVCRLE